MQSLHSAAMATCPCSLMALICHPKKTLIIKNLAICRPHYGYTKASCNNKSARESEQRRRNIYQTVHYIGLKFIKIAACPINTAVRQTITAMLQYRHKPTNKVTIFLFSTLLCVLCINRHR